MAAYALTSIGTILTRLQQRTQAPASSYWAEQEYLYAINEALRFWQALTGDLTATIYVGSANLDGAWLEVPRQLIGVNRVSVAGRPLAQEELGSIDYSRPNWETSTGTPKLWIPDGTTRIGIFPRPSTPVVFLLEGPAEANNLGVGDFVNLGNEELTDILDYCLHYLSIKEGSPEMDSTMSGMKQLVLAGAERNQQLRKTNLFKKA